jgi:hypothetical protein
MSTIESLSELAIWDEYRSFMKERLGQLPSGDVPFLLSKTKVDFKVGGGIWKGYVVMVGAKGAATAKILKKDGVQFREGKCQAQGTELMVSGLDDSSVKAAAVTLNKLHLGFSIAGADDAQDDAEAPPVASAQLAKRLESLLADIKRASGVTTKETEPFLVQARQRAKDSQALIDSDPVKATKLLQEGEEFARQAMAGTSESGEAATAAKVEARRQELLGEIAEAEKLKEPANKDLIENAKKAAQAVLVAVGKKQYDTVEKLFDSIEGMLSQMVEGPEPPADADPDLPGIGDWKEYRTFMKVNLKRIPKEGGPAFISREKVTFTVEGKPFESHAVLVGQKGRVLVQILRRAGTQFMEGTARLDGALLKVGGIKMALLKGAAKTMLKLKAGCKIVPEGALPPDEDGDAGDTPDDPIGKESIEKEIKAVAELLVKLRDALDTQKKSIAGLKQDADDKRKAADAAAKRARELGDKGTDTPKDWDDLANANTAAETAKFTAKRAATDSDRGLAELRQFTDALVRIRGAVDSDSNKKASLKKLKDQVTGRLLDMAIVNIDTKDPNAGKIIADQIKKRFGVSFNLKQSKITGRDKDNNQVFKDNDKKVDPKKEAATLKELYVTLSRAPVFPASQLKTLNISLRPKESESEGGVYYEDSKTAEITCRRPGESFNYGDQLNSASYFPDGVDENCKAANSDPVNYFDWATLHEVAHAVDAKHKFMATNGKGTKYGAWVEYGNAVEPVATVVANEFGKSLAAQEKAKLEKYALALMKNKKTAAPATPEQTAVKNWVDSVRVGKGIWWDGVACNTLAIGGRVYQEAYDFGGGWWNSYDLSARKQGIHGYQFRAPGEWFAELYAAYYSDKLKPSHPFVPDLAKLELPSK